MLFCLGESDCPNCELDMQPQLITNDCSSAYQDSDDDGTSMSDGDDEEDEGPHDAILRHS